MSRREFPKSVKVADWEVVSQFEFLNRPCTTNPTKPIAAAAVDPTMMESTASETEKPIGLNPASITTAPVPPVYQQRYL